MRQSLPFLGKGLVICSARQCLDGHLARNPEENKNRSRLLKKKKMPALSELERLATAAFFPSF